MKIIVFCFVLIFLFFFFLNDNSLKIFHVQHQTARASAVVRLPAKLYPQGTSCHMTQERRRTRERCSDDFPLDFFCPVTLSLARSLYFQLYCTMIPKCLFFPLAKKRGLYSNCQSYMAAPISYEYLCSIIIIIIIIVKFLPKKNNLFFIVFYLIFKPK